LIKYKELRINRIISITLLVITLFSLFEVVPCFAAEIRIDPAGTADNYTVNLTVANSTGNDSEVNTDYATVKEASSESEWLEFQKDSSNSGYTFSSAPTRNPKIIWQSLTSSKQEPCGSGGVNVPPLISGNKNCGKCFCLGL